MRFPRNCPLCKTQHDAEREAAPLPGQNTGREPRSGDFGLCFDCGGLFTFDEKEPGGCRAPTPKETAEAEGHPVFQRAQMAWRHHKGGVRQ